MAHIALTFDNNKLASALYGQFDENLARLEQKLGVDIRSKGNQLTIKGDPTAAEQARRALDHLYAILQKGAEIAQSDVDGAVRMALATDDQLTLPTLERKGKVSAAQIATRKRTIYARSLNQDAYMRALERSNWCSASARPAPANLSRLPMPRCCWSAAWWNASSCRGRPSRPANGWASCRAT
jgi:phosphate starvation-inducible PhoH-like protein